MAVFSTPCSPSNCSSQLLAHRCFSQLRHLGKTLSSRSVNPLQLKSCCYGLWSHKNAFLSPRASSNLISAEKGTGTPVEEAEYEGPVLANVQNDGSGALIFSFDERNSTTTANPDVVAFLKHNGDGSGISMEKISKIIGVPLHDLHKQVNTSSEFSDLNTQNPLLQNALELNVNVQTIPSSIEIEVNAEIGTEKEEIPAATAEKGEVEDTKEEIVDEIKGEIVDEFKGEILDEIKEEIVDEIKEEIVDEIKEEIVDEIKEEILDEFKGEILDEIKEEIVGFNKQEIGHEAMEEFFDAKEDIESELIVAKTIVRGEVKYDENLQVSPVENADLGLISSDVKAETITAIESVEPEIKKGNELEEKREEEKFKSLTTTPSHEENSKIGPLEFESHLELQLEALEVAYEMRKDMNNDINNNNNIKHSDNNSSNNKNINYHSETNPPLPVSVQSGETQKVGIKAQVANQIKSGQAEPVKEVKAEQDDFEKQFNKVYQIVDLVKNVLCGVGIYLTLNCAMNFGSHMTFIQKVYAILPGSLLFWVAYMAGNWQSFMKSLPRRAAEVELADFLGRWKRQAAVFVITFILLNFFTGRISV